MGLLSKLFSYVPKLSGGILTEGESRWWGGSPSWTGGQLHAGESVTSANLLTSATCFACTKALSETTAGLPSAVYSGVTANKKEIARENPAWELLVEQPNPEMDSFTFMDLIVSRVINGGNFFAEIQRDRRDRPIALWPIHPSRVEPLREDDGTLVWQIASDYTGNANFQDPTWRRQHTRLLSNHHMLNIVGFGSTNGIISPGVLPGAQEISLDFATRRYGADFFRNGATPIGMVQHPGFIDDPNKRTNFRDDLNRFHNNKTGGSKIGVLWDGATYQQIGVAPEQAQFLETRKYTADQICKLYGVPPAIVGDYKDSKFATADAMIRAFVMITLRNLVVRIERALNRQILNVKGRGGRLESAFDSSLIYKLAIDGLLRGDPKMQAETWKIMREGGVATANDWLRDLDMNTIDGPEGEYRIVPGGYVRLENIDNQGTRAERTNEPAKTDTKDDAANLPTFNRDAMVEMLQETVEKTENVAKVRGVDLLGPTVVELATDAISRIHAISTTQINRWREQDPSTVAEKMAPFWEKQRERIMDALAPADKVAAKMNPDAMIAKTLADAYMEQFSALDNYSVFDAARTKLNLDTYSKLVEGQL